MSTAAKKKISTGNVAAMCINENLSRFCIETNN